MCQLQLPRSHRIRNQYHNQHRVPGGHDNDVPRNYHDRLKTSYLIPDGHQIENKWQYSRGHHNDSENIPPQSCHDTCDIDDIRPHRCQCKKENKAPGGHYSEEKDILPQSQYSRNHSLLERNNHDQASAHQTIVWESHLIYLRFFVYAVIVVSMCIPPQSPQTLEKTISTITIPTQSDSHYISTLSHSVLTLGNLNLESPMKNCTSPLPLLTLSHFISALRYLKVMNPFKNYPNLLPLLIKIIHPAGRRESDHDMLVDVITSFILLTITNWTIIIKSIHPSRHLITCMYIVLSIIKRYSPTIITSHHSTNTTTMTDRMSEAARMNESSSDEELR